MCDPCPGSVSYSGLITVTALLASGPAWQCAEGQAVLEPCLLAEAEGGRGVERGLGQGCNRLEEGYIASSTRGLAAALGSRTQQGDCSLQRGWPAILECDG